MDSWSKSGVHVFVVDEDGSPVTGQDVSAHFSYAHLPDTVSHQFTDVEGRADFSHGHPAEPVYVEIFVRGESFGPHTVESRATYSVEISRE